VFFSASPLGGGKGGGESWFAPDEKHWHDILATTAMTHIAIQERLDGKTADWMEKVSVEQYPDPKLLLEVRAVTKNTWTSFNSGKDRSSIRFEEDLAREPDGGRPGMLEQRVSRSGA
jgi:hypothetical protein